MPNLFLFSNTLESDSCLSLKLNDDGQSLAPAEQRNFEDIRALQADAKTTVVMPANQASIFSLQLPRLSEKKARQAIPYALEEQLSEPLDALHFAFESLHSEPHSYLVVVIEKLKMEQLIETLKTKGLTFNAITLDWFALNEHESCLTTDQLLVYQEDYKGALSLNLAEHYLKNPQAGTYLSFSDSNKSLTTLEFEALDEPCVNWLAHRLQRKKPMNLCQGEYQQQEEGEFWHRRGYQWLAALAALWLLFMIVADLFNIHQLNQNIAQIDKKIEVIYKEFFPDAKQVISPKFRISQIIGEGSESKQGKFWSLLSQLSNALAKSDAQIEKLTYQNDRLNMTLACPDFASLERLENQLKQLQLKVKKTQAASRDKQVIATLELM